MTTKHYIGMLYRDCEHRNLSSEITAGAVALIRPATMGLDKLNSIFVKILAALKNAGIEMTDPASETRGSIELIIYRLVTLPGKGKINEQNN